MTSRFEFPANGNRPGLSLYWDHAENGPDVLRQLGLKGKGMNNLFVGTDGLLLCGFDRHELLPAEKYAGFQRPEPSIQDSPGFHNEWIAACKGGSPATCNWNYSGPLAETVLLANVACRAEGGFDWDAKTLTASGNPRATQFLMSHFEPEWQI
jgi:hypothetical protein